MAFKPEIDDIRSSLSYKIKKILSLGLTPIILKVSEKAFNTEESNLEK